MDKLGPYELNTIVHGDCLDVMPELPAGSFDMILCDLPYGQTACAWDSIIPLEPLWAEYKRLIKPAGAIVLTGSQPFTSMLVMSNLDWFKYEWVWDKVIGSNFQLANYQPLKRHESILVFSDSPAVFVKSGNCMIYNPQMFKTNPDNIRPQKDGKSNQNMTRIRSSNLVYQTPADISFPTSIVELNKNKGECNPAANKIHPTQKPVALFSYLIRTYTHPGAVILDNCAGSGTTAIAAIETGRNWFCIEKDAGYFEIAKRRIEERLQQPFLFDPIATDEKPTQDSFL